MRTFRGLRYFLAPPWLTGRGDGEKVAFTIEWILDAFLERVRQGLEARFPSRAGISAINLIIGDRGLIRGRDESLAALAARLIAWRTPRTHRVRGNAYEVLRQVWQYWQSWNPGYVSIFDAHYVTHSKQSDGVESRDDFGSWEWDELDPDVHWSRFWVTISNDGIEPQPDLGDAALWGGALGTPGYTLGQLNVRPEDVTAMRAMFQELKWSPAHAVPEWLIVGVGLANMVFTAESGASANGTDSFTLNVPYFTSEPGALLFMQIASEAGTVATPTAWTLINLTTNGTFKQYLFARVKAEDEADDSGPEGASVPVVVTAPGGRTIGRMYGVGTEADGGDAVRWNDTDVAANFATEIVTTGSGTSIASPDFGQLRVSPLVFTAYDSGGTFTGFGDNYLEIDGEQTAGSAAGGIGIVAQIADGALYEYDDSLTATLGNTGAWVSLGVVLAPEIQLRPNPSGGDWRYWSEDVGGVRVEVRNNKYRYWSLDPTRNNTYSGDRTRPWPAAAVTVEGDFPGYTGDRSNASAWNTITLPNGETYRGVRRFSARVLLVDDGSVPV